MDQNHLPSLIQEVLILETHQQSLNMTEHTMSQDRVDSTHIVTAGLQKNKRSKERGIHRERLADGRQLQDNDCDAAVCKMEAKRRAENESTFFILHETLLKHEGDPTR